MSHDQQIYASKYDQYHAERDSMGMCCCEGGPVDGEIYTRDWQTDLMGACCAEPLWCMLPICCPQIGMYCLRKKVLQDKMEDYVCCQGYYACCCYTPVCCHEQDCPEFCLFCEACCMPGLAMWFSKFWVMEKARIRSDPCDNRIIRCRNAVMCLACIMRFIGIVFKQARDLVPIIDAIADIVYWTVFGCTAAQVAHEMNYIDGPMQGHFLNTDNLAGQVVPGQPMMMATGGQQVFTQQAPQMVVMQQQPQTQYVQQPQTQYVQQPQGQYVQQPPQYNQ
jgi:hypothetical protein